MSLWKRQPETVRDAVGAIPLVIIFVVAQHLPDGGSLVRAIVIVAVMGVALTLRRRWPMVTFAAALSTVAVATTGLEFLAIASYTLVAHEPRAHPGAVAAVSALAASIGFLQYWPALVLGEIAGDLFLIAGVSVLPPVIGQAVRASRRTTAELTARNTELLALRERAAEHAVEAERFRIARELHDVVAHHVSAMTVRARAGRHVAARDPQAAEDALAYIAEAGTETLTAMGSFVGTLRGKGASAGRDGLAPQPTLADLPALVESFRGTGLVVHDELALPSAAVTPALGLNAYRIVQEGLTNAIRHGAAERAWVRVWTEADVLRVQVDDNGRGTNADGHSGGHGLVGVAERVALHDGTSAFGPSPRGGCRLEATLVLRAGEPCAPDDLGVPAVRA